MWKAVQAKNPKSFHPVELSVSSTFFLEASTVLQCCLYGSRAKWSPWQELWFNLRSDLRRPCWHLELSPFEPYLLTHLISKNAWEGKATPNITYVGSTLHPITSYEIPLNPIQYQYNSNSTSSPFPMQRFVPVSQKNYFAKFCANLGSRISISKLLRPKKGENARKRQIDFIVPTLRVSLWISGFLFKDIICHVVDVDSSFVVRVSDSISWIWPLLLW